MIDRALDAWRWRGERELLLDAREAGDMGAGQSALFGAPRLALLVMYRLKSLPE